MTQTFVLRTLAALLITQAMTGCSVYRYFKSKTADGAPSTEVDVRNTPNPIPKNEPLSAFGNAATYHVRGKTYHVLATAKGYHKQGKASWYGTKFHGRLTSTREPYNMFAMTAASPELPIPCYVKVTNLDNNRTAIVRVNDRGPFHGNRIMDLSYAAAQKLGVLKTGTAHVDIRAIDPSSQTIAHNNIDLTEGVPTLQLGAFASATHAQERLAWLQQYQSLGNARVIRQKNMFKIRLTPDSPSALKMAKKTLKKLHIGTMIVR